MKTLSTHFFRPMTTLPTTEAKIRFHISPLFTMRLNPSSSLRSYGLGKACEAVALNPLLISCHAAGPCIPTSDVIKLFNTTDLTYSGGTVALATAAVSKV